jgi:uncharacterized lipoprotein YehR (DUF1307 family)
MLEDKTMKKKMSLLVIPVMALVFGMTVVGCDDNGGSDPEPYSGELDPALFGKWLCEEDGDVLTFNQNGTYSWIWEEMGEDEVGRWSASGGIFTIKFDGKSEDYPYTFNGKGELFIFDRDDSWRYVKQ